MNNNNNTDIEMYRVRTNNRMFDKMFIETHNQDFYEMFNWIMNSEKGWDNHEVYSSFVKDFLYWCKINNKLNQG